jgi:transposase
MDREVERLCRERYPETAVLRQVKGVGPVTALAFVLVIEDPNRFGKSRSVGTYLGLCPRRRDSGEQRPQLRISKAGDPLLRRLLVTAAHYVLGPFGPDTDLRRFGLALAERGGTAGKKRAVVAVARRLAVLLHRLWVTGEVYQPLGYDAAQAKAA